MAEGFFCSGEVYIRERDGTRAGQRQSALLWTSSLACVSLLWGKKEKRGALSHGMAGEVGREL